MVKVVSAVCGIQAQVITAAELAIGARVDGVTQQDVRDEIWERRTLVKTYGPRTTLHLLPAAELPMWMTAMRARESLIEQPWYASVGLTHEQVDALLGGIKEALDGRCLTREELAHEVGQRVGTWASERLGSTWGELLSPAAQEGLLCFGPSRGSKVTFVRADQWTGLDTRAEQDPMDALAEVLRRYLTAYGPADHKDFARWFWLKPDKALPIFDLIKDELTEIYLEGKPGWVLTNTLENKTPNRAASSVRLLPQYDCYVLGAVPREMLVPTAARQRIARYGRGRYEGAVGVPVLVVDGVVAGIWERTGSGKRLSIRVEPFVDLTLDQQHQLEEEANRIGKFLAREVTFSVGALS